MLRRKTRLKAKSGFKKKGGKLNPVSQSRRKKNDQYSKAKKEYFNSVNSTCEICGMEATDIHHKNKRGKNLSNINTFMAVCRPCHNKIHDNPAWARENNYLIYEYK